MKLLINQCKLTTVANSAQDYTSYSHVLVYSSVLSLVGAAYDLVVM